ncbi:hypothetical protein PHMEG_0009379 [Phytophthora megakarya]|uniref:Uncharacterized protein n=1 Tax=Phytophthora megakarya TaxID=4795 RepID=A0A225WGC1_9STRA|nr:hypothetical protein PHMEG_0009379 [Phytophthora megakarya]
MEFTFGQHLVHFGSLITLRFAFQLAYQSTLGWQKIHHGFADAEELVYGSRGLHFPKELGETLDDSFPIGTNGILDERKERQNLAAMRSARANLHQVTSNENRLRVHREFNRGSLVGVLDATLASVLGAVEVDVGDDDDFDAALLPEDSWEQNSSNDVFEVESIQDVQWVKRTRTARRPREYLVKRKGVDSGGIAQLWITIVRIQQRDASKSSFSGDAGWG